MNEDSKELVGDIADGRSGYVHGAIIGEVELGYRRFRPTWRQTHDGRTIGRNGSTVS